MAEEFTKSNNNNESKKKEDSDVNKEQENPADENQNEVKDKPIIIRADAYKTIILYASRYANNSLPPEQWKEIYGILIGYSDDEVVYVERAEALTFGHATDVQLDSRHYGFIEKIQERLDKEEKDYYMVGWFHSHPGLNLFFSYIDLINQLGFQQNNNDFFGLVFDHTLLGKKKEEVVKSEDGTEYAMKKYDTGFEIYKITDVNLDINDAAFDSNYHKLDYIVDGLNKYFFANVLSELSALVSEGKPLQTAYGEEENNRDTSPKTNEEDSFIGSELTEIPMDEEIAFDVDNFSFLGTETKKKQRKSRTIEEADQLIYEGNLAFENRDSVSGIEKFRKGIEKYNEVKDFEKVLDLLRIVAQKCISNDHLIFAEEFANDLHKRAKKNNQLFYTGVANYILGYLLLKKGDTNVLKEGLKTIQEAAIIFEKEGDFAGAGMCFNKIGTIYHSRLSKVENACLFYRAAIENYNQAILKIHPLRTSFWNKPELLIQKIVELRDIVDDLIPNLNNSELGSKISADLRNLHYNF